MPPPTDPPSQPDSAPVPERHSEQYTSIGPSSPPRSPSSRDSSPTPPDWCIRQILTFSPTDYDIHHNDSPLEQETAHKGWTPPPVRPCRQC